MKHARADYDRIQDPAGKIGENEPVMLFRAQDELFREVVQHYRELHARKYGAATRDIQEACEEHLKRADEWYLNNPSKQADL